MGYTPPPKNDLTHYVGLPDAVHLGYGGYQTLRGHIRRGALPAVKVNGRWKVLRSDLDALAVIPSQVLQNPQLDAHIQALVKAAPALSDTQVATLRDTFGGAAA